MGYDIIASGYVSMDHIIKIDSPARSGCTSIVTNVDNTKIYYGGCAVNICVALNRLGKKALPLMRVGRDYKENGFYDYLCEANVPLEGAKLIEDELTATCYLVQDKDGNHITLYYPGADRVVDQGHDSNLFDDAKYGVITVADRRDNRAFLDNCKSRNIPIIFGMKDDFNAFPRDFLYEILTESQIIFMNEIESQILTEMYELSSITDLFQIGKVKILVITMGSKGSLCYERKEENDIQSFQVGIYKTDNVVDATGTGDAYISGFLYGFLEHRSLIECCKLGAALAYYVIQAPGCSTNIPSILELEAMIKNETQGGK